MAAEVSALTLMHRSRTVKNAVDDVYSWPQDVKLLFLDTMSLDLDLEQYQDHLNNNGTTSMDDADSQDADLSGHMRNHAPNQAEKRAHHNALERKRRDHIKGSFSDLRDVIPSLKGEKVVSKAAILFRIV
jgi:hypothetical protein